MNDLDRAIILYVGLGLSPFPKTDETRVINEFGEAQGVVLAGRVREILKELDRNRPNWDQYNLADGTKWAVDQLRLKYPELSDEGARALEWIFSYAWR